MRLILCSTFNGKHDVIRIFITISFRFTFETVLFYFNRQFASRQELLRVLFFMCCNLQPKNCGNLPVWGIKFQKVLRMCLPVWKQCFKRLCLKTIQRCWRNSTLYDVVTSFECSLFNDQSGIFIIFCLFVFVFIFVSFNNFYLFCGINLTQQTHNIN